MLLFFLETKFGKIKFLKIGEEDDEPRDVESIEDLLDCMEPGYRVSLSDLLVINEVDELTINSHYLSYG